MKRNHAAPIGARNLTGQSGAFDLPSILVAVAVVGILTAGILVALFGVIPWAQDQQAKDSLAAVRTAEGTHVAKDKGFVDLAGLQSATYLPAAVERLTVDVNEAGTCYLGIAKSQTGKVFYSSDKANEPREMTPATPTTPGTTAAPCLSSDTVQDRVDDVGGYDPEVYEPVGDGDGTSTDPGVPTKTSSETSETVTPNKDVTTAEVRVAERTVEVGFQNTSSSPTTVRYAGRVTCYDPARETATVEDVDGYFDLNSNIYADMTLVVCSPGTQAVDVEFRPFDTTYTATKGGTYSGSVYRWRAPVQYRQATWVTRGLTASYDGQWCIENKDNASTEGNPIFLAPCAKVDAQRWQWNGDGEIRQSTLDHKCAATAADKLILSACSTPGQQFKAENFQGENKTGGLVQIVHAATGKCVDIPGGVLASVQLSLAGCNGTGTQSWYMPGLAGTLKPELQQPEIIDPEPMTPVANANTAGMEIVPSAGTNWNQYYVDRAVTAQTSTGFRIAFGVNGATNSANYDVQWSGAALNATGTVKPATATPIVFGSQITWYGQVTAASGGFKEGTGYVTATITEKATGKKSVKSWKVTVNPVAIVAPTSLYNWDRTYWVDRTTTEKTSKTHRFALAINNAAASDFTTTWSGGSKVNAVPGANVIIPDSQAVHYSNFTAGAGGYTTGTDTITATVRHNATGTVMTKTWTITVNPVAIVAPTSLYNWDRIYWVDRTTTEKTSNTNRFALAINDAAASDFTTTWSGGAKVNAIPGANAIAGDSQAVHYSNFTAGSGGYTTGTDTITATVRHNATGTVMTKTWTITVNPVAIVAPTSLVNWDRLYWVDRTVAVGTTGTTRFAFGITQAKANDFTVAWSGGSEVNATPGTPTYSDQSSQGVYWSDFKPGSGGYKAGTSTITATVTHVPTGRTMTKTWTLTVK